jgi:prepilin-type N-terminal cleavage/methylation domain-containing protein
MKSLGFTLVEVLLVMVIVGIIGGVIFVAVNGQREKARISSVKQTAESILPLAKECHFRNGFLTDSPEAGNPICSSVKEAWPEIKDENCQYSVTASGDKYEIVCLEYGVRFVCYVTGRYGCEEIKI